jgi:hypothetical protein
VDAGRKESGVDKVEVVAGECETAIQIINLLDDLLAALLRRFCLVDDEWSKKSSGHHA